jgi:hypothetical protein
MRELNKLWVGLVEDNKDPDRLGRIKVRVQSIFDDIPVEDIPWASPIKTLSSRSYEMPSIGKIVSVFFPNNNLYEPYYMYADHYNVNLKKKLEDLGEDEYVNFIAVIFDHKTKIYSDDTELVMDYLYNKISIDNDNINLELKDNNRKVNIGCATASQQAVLGNHWFEWFDKFINELVKPMSLIGNSGAAILKPQIDLLLVEYQTLRETFLSDHVYIVDDLKIEKLPMDYNSPIMDDGVKLNATPIAGNISGSLSNQSLSSSIKEQKDKELEKLKDAIPSDAKIEGETKDNPDAGAFSGDVDNYKEIKGTGEFDITKTRYDEIKSKEAAAANLTIYEYVDDYQDPDDIAFEFMYQSPEDEYEASDADDIAYGHDSTKQYEIYKTESGEKYVDKSEKGKTSKVESDKIVTCSEINSSNWSPDLWISPYFRLSDLSTRTPAGSHTIREQKIIDGVVYTKYDIACNLKALCINVLDKIKERYDDLIITSALRNNGGSSQHEKGQAADMQFSRHKQKEYVNIAKWINANINYDQLLFEYRDPNSVWIHVSWNRNGQRGLNSAYPKYATFHNDKIYKRLQIIEYPGFSYRA